MDKIDPKPGEIWLRRDGGKARIYAIDGAGEFLTHGATKTEDGWVLDSWTEKGKIWIDGDSDCDLIQKYDWREELKPIWAMLKPDFRWIAMDESGSWWTYQDTPNTGDTFWETIGELESLEAFILPTPDCPWYETLTERPE